MARILIATFGSLGDIHPKIALGLELKKRGHEVIFCAMEYYREKAEMLGFEFHPMRPSLHPEDRELAKEIMDAQKGTEKIIRELIFGNIRQTFDDLLAAAKNADIMITGEIIYAAKSVVEKTGIKWVSTSLAPCSFFSAYDPMVPPVAQWFQHLRFMGVNFHKIFFAAMRLAMRNWYGPYRAFRRDLGLSEDHDPILSGKYSDDTHLALFSKAIGAPQPDWPKQAKQCGFCFYDGMQDLGNISEDLQKFLDAGEPPIVFTLGSAAVMDARDFFDESIKAAKMLNKRAVMLYGIYNEAPKGLDNLRVGFDYAPYSQILPRAAAVIHQGGIGTTSQVLRAGVPHIFVPFAHDQPDNAARCRRLGVAEEISRNSYNAESVANKLRKIFADGNYRAKAQEVKSIIEAENGTETACDAIEDLLKK